MGILNSGNMLGRIGSLLTGAAAGFEARMEMDRQQARADAIDARNWGRQLDLLGRQQGFQVNMLERQQGFQGEQARLGREHGFALQKGQQQYTSQENELARNAQQEAAAAQQGAQATLEENRAVQEINKQKFLMDYQEEKRRASIAPAIDDRKKQLQDAEKKLASREYTQREYDQISGQLRSQIASIYSGVPPQPNPADAVLAGNMPSKEALDAADVPAYMRRYTVLNERGQIAYRPSFLSNEDADDAWSNSVGSRAPGLSKRPWYMMGYVNEKGVPSFEMLPDVKIKTELYRTDMIDYKARRTARESEIAEWNKGYALLLTQEDKTKPETMEKLSKFEKSKPAPFNEPPPRDPLEDRQDSPSSGSKRRVKDKNGRVVMMSDADILNAIGENINKGDMMYKGLTNENEMIAKFIEVYGEK